MFDTTVHSGQQAGTPEQVAYQLLCFIREHAMETFVSKRGVLDTYAECLVAARGERLPK